MEALEGRVLFAAGDFDTTFGGGDGAALVNFAPASSDQGTTLVALPDGKTLVGGSVGDGTNSNDDFGIARLNADGSLDTTWGGGDGLVTVDFGGGDSDLNALAVTSTGKIIAVGKTEANGTADWAIARLNADGTPDTTFDADGKVVTDFFGFADAAFAVDVQANGRIVVTGTNTGVNQDIAVVRYLDNGALDQTFDGDGRAFVNFFGGADAGSAVKVQADNKIVVAGGSVQPGSYRRFVLVRFNANGSLDTTFGTGGEATANFGADAWAKDIELTADGKYLVGGWLDTDTTGDAAQLDMTVARFNANGALDASFGTLGRTTFHTGGEQLGLYGLEVQQNGKILIGGTAMDAAGLTYAAVARMTTGGAPDTTFGPAGLRQFTIPGTVAGSNHVGDLELAADGKILLAGYGTAAAGGTGADFAVVRLLNDDLPAGSISGAVFNDANGNGVRDIGETGAAGVTVYQDLNNNGRLDGGPVTYPSTGAPVVIPESHPDGPVTVTSTINVAGATGPITDVNVTLDISHTWDDDLHISLVGPSGHEVVLIHQRGLSGDNFTNTVLDDEATRALSTGSAPFTGSFKPEDPLSGFDGLDPNGTWTLKVTDLFDTEGGTINSWSLAISGQAEPSAVTAADGTYSFPSVQPGTYTLREVVPAGQTQTAPAAGSYAVDVLSGQVAGGRDFGNAQGVVAAAVVGRRVFYNHSGFDGNNAAANAQDDAAIATDKQAMLPGATATLANVTGYSRGINGVMVDIARLPGELTAADFDFKVGNTATPDTWAAAPAPLSITSRPSGLGDGSTRVSIVWADGAIKNQLLQVTVKANANTGLTNPDVFIFGNLVGETVTSAGSAALVVNASDVTATRLAKRNVAVPVTEPADHNRDGRVNVLDDEIVRSNYGKSLYVVAPAVVARSVFYNQSSFDGNNAAANSADDGAIATDKQALLPGATATAANVTGYSSGINGVMVDVTGTPGALTAADFDFKVGNTGAPATWAAAPAPVSITQRPSGRADGATRVSLVWADGAIKNQWLQVTVKADANTRIARPDVFYFGNLVGGTAHTAGAATFAVNGSDVTATRFAPRRNKAVTVTEAADHNGDGRVNVLDDEVVRRNYGRTLSVLTGPAAGAAASVSQAVFGVTSISALRERGTPATRAVLG
jgi:uncharacterized delta-60 repeat protein